MTNEQIQQLKEFYKQTTIRQDRVDELWMQLSNKLPDKQDTAHRYSPSFAMASLLVIVILGLSFQVVSAAKPTSILYPVRLLADTIGAKVTGNYDLVVEKRADDIINAAKKKSPAAIHEAAKAYTDSLENVKTASSSSEKKGHVREALKRSEQKLKTITPANPQSKSIIDNAIKSTSQTVQDVKGARNDNRGSETSEERRQDKNEK